MNPSQTLATEELPVLARLEQLDIPFDRYEHPPIATGDEASSTGRTSMPCTAKTCFSEIRRAHGTTW